MTDVPAVPSGFWPQIDHQLDRITAEKPDTFDGVRDILLDPAYDEITAEIHRNGLRSFDLDSAFFAGSGGDASLLSALGLADWWMTTFSAGYHYAVTHPGTSETLTYTEGDVQRGNLFT